MKFSRTWFLLAPLVSLPSTLAWGAAGHAIVATIGEIFLTPTARSAICDILPDWAKCHLAPIASWADRVKNHATAPLHYINGVRDWPPSNCLFGGNEWTDPKHNILVGILNTTAGVTNLEGEERDFALRYLVHFIGDLHQPLHLAGRDRGGNQDRVRWNHRITNLHSVWDGGLIGSAIGALTNYTDPVPSKKIESALTGAIYDKYIRFIVWEGILGWWKDELGDWSSCPASSSFDGLLAPDQLPNSLFAYSEDEALEILDPAEQLTFQQHKRALAPPYPSDILSRPSQLKPGLEPELPVCPFDWAKPIHDLNCDTTLIWPQFLVDVPPHDGPPPRTPAPDLVELNKDWYAGTIRDGLVIEKLLATAGWRLASVLNQILDPNDAGKNDNVEGLPVPRIWLRD